jgi:hypothetical protein
MLLNEVGVATDAVCSVLVERNVVTVKFPWEAVAVPRSVPTMCFMYSRWQVVRRVSLLPFAVSRPITAFRPYRQTNFIYN